MPKAKWPHFSSVNPIIPKGSCYTLRKKVAIWPSNVGSVRLLFALYDKTNGGEESRSEGCQLVAWTLWYRWSGHNLLAHAMIEACTTTAPANTARPGCGPAATRESEPWCWDSASLLPPARASHNLLSARPLQSPHGTDLLQALLKCGISWWVQSVT